jgi:hypothetical protein
VNLKDKFDALFRGIRRFTIHELHEVFTNVSPSVLYENVTVHLRYRKNFARWI